MNKTTLFIIISVLFFCFSFPQLSFATESEDQLLSIQAEILKVQDIVLSAIDKLSNNETLSSNEAEFIFNQINDIINSIKLISPDLTTEYISY